MSDFWIGFFTFPAGCLLGLGLFYGAAKLSDWLADRGWTMEFKIGRNYESISDFIIRRDIWFEKQHGPIFTGHWCRDEYRYRDEKSFTVPVVTRWLGIGKAQGNSIMLFKKRDLDSA